ncbi:MAG: transcriptional regulator [Robiginitomaculum sp.]|nr:MAG: transcriptional regulator [Robiginitomaculum sp.]
MKKDMSAASPRKTGCPVAFSLDVLGDRWSLLIVRDMLVGGASTYGDFMCGGEGIATNILANRLKGLTDAGIVEKHRDETNRRKYRYTLTQKGCELVPIVLSLMNWGAKYDPETRATPEILKKVTAKLDMEFSK